MLMRGGTSKGLYFAASDLPADKMMRDLVLLSAMGSPDVRQIDGLGGAHPLTSKAALLSPPTHPAADIDYLFLQVSVDTAEVRDDQNCGNILAGVGPWAVENGFIQAQPDITPVRIHMVNTGTLAVAYVPTPGGTVEYDGLTRIDGVPGTAAAIPIDFLDIAGSSCGALLPTGNVTDEIGGVEVTCVDNGMPVVLIRATDLGKTGHESPAELEADDVLKHRIELIRLAAGPLMNLGDVTKKTVPKMTLLAPAKNGGFISTRSFIPHRVHEAIGVLGAVSVATGCVMPASIASGLTSTKQIEESSTLDIEHPTGAFSVSMKVNGEGKMLKVERAALLRTARKLMKGEVYIKGAIRSADMVENWEHV
ncbi:4-oxalomesaconate tautomerase [Acidocella sp.]|uniref:4-oxalomesaconate tautomerase n=1 Tax=Acidocella sp. TaxID=50710 RepID=UPI003D01F535